MTAKIFLRIQVDPEKGNKILVDNLDMDKPVQILRQSAAEKTNMPFYKIALVYRGVLLNDESTLAGAGLRPGVTVYVLKAVEKGEVPPLKLNASTQLVMSLTRSFQRAAKNPNFRTALQKLSRPDALEHITSAWPGLLEDPVSMALVQDPVLMAHLCDAGVVSRLVKLHPRLIEAAQYILQFIQAEAVSGRPALPSAYSYTMDALSDDEDMESPQSSDSQSNPAYSLSAITSIQLAQALAAAQAEMGSTTTPGDQSSTSSISAGGSIITSEMFSQALGQAFAAASVGDATQSSASSGPATTPQAPSQATSELQDLEATSRRLNDHLQQMHELGLHDDTLNLQALQATDWNVHEAINLVFSGVMGDEPDSMD